MKKLVIFGVAEMGEIAHHYFSKYTGREVVAFSVDSNFIKESTFCGLPVVPFEIIIAAFPPEQYDVFVAIGFSVYNSVRKEKYLAAKALGYGLPSFISEQATVLNEKAIGDNCFIFEDNTIQPFVRIGNNVTLWSGNHIGHHSVIKDHVFITSHVVVSGGVIIGEQCFIGVNAALRDHITVGDRCILGAGTLILSDCPSDSVYKGIPTAVNPPSSLRK